jgi:hypothetical protein
MHIFLSYNAYNINLSPGDKYNHHKPMLFKRILVLNPQERVDAFHWVMDT